MQIIGATKFLLSVVTGMLMLSVACVSPSTGPSTVPRIEHYRFSVIVMNAAGRQPVEGDVRVFVRDAEGEILATAQAAGGVALVSFDSDRLPHHLEAILFHHDGTMVGALVSYRRLAIFCMHLPDECLSN